MTDEAIYRCRVCLDTGWEEYRCCATEAYRAGPYAAPRRACDRQQKHYDHTYVVRCGCYVPPVRPQTDAAPPKPRRPYAR